MEYYWNTLALLEEIGENKKKGVEIHELFKRKYRAGSSVAVKIGINKALKQLRKNSCVHAERVRYDMFYWYVKPGKKQKK